ERTTGGLGIGLALVKGLVEMHGGSITAESPGTGKGSTFAVELPALACPVQAEPQEMMPAAPQPDRRRILVVDDNHDSAPSTAIMLQLKGNNVRTAYDGMEAIKIAETFQPHVILMDVGMPRLSGYEAAQEIRKQAWGQGITIVALTGWGQERDKEKSQEAGCD